MLYYTTQSTVTDSQNPIIHIHFNSTEGYSLDDLFHTWITHYETKIYFSFVFHTKDIIDIPSIWYVCKMAMFMYSLKVRYPHTHYLRESHILIHDVAIQNLLEWTFAIQRPVAPVYIYQSDVFDTTNTPVATIHP